MCFSLTMTFKKPSSDSSSGDEWSKNDDNADGAPLDDTRGDRPTADNAKNKRFGRLEALLAAERKKRAKAEQKVATEQMHDRKLRGEIKVNSTEHGIALKKVKTVLAQHKARDDAAALGAKNEKFKAERLTSKELLSNEDNSLKESQKSCSQLVKALETSSKDLKKAQESISKHDNERGELTCNHHDLRGQVKPLETASKKTNNEDDARAPAKMAHEKEMAVLKLLKAKSCISPAK
jgi:hypothetical protein